MTDWMGQHVTLVEQVAWDPAPPCRLPPRATHHSHQPGAAEWR
ncbi:MAG: hypothetical protein ACK583_16105 [Cyanobacteriota bacterium]